MKGSTYLNPLLGPLDVESQRVARSLKVKQCMIPLTGTAAIKAVKANVETARVVLTLSVLKKVCNRSGAYNGIEALCTIFTID